MTRRELPNNVLRSLTLAGPCWLINAASIALIF